MKCTYLIKPIGLIFFLCFIPIWMMAQSITAKGVVRDSNGEPIPGANVLQQGSTNGTITDFDGNYSLNVPSNAKLVFSFIGYKNIILDVSGKKILDVSLKEDTKTLDEIVVIGYGTAKKSDVTGSIATVNEKTLKEGPTSNIAS